MKKYLVIFAIILMACGGFSEVITDIIQVEDSIQTTTTNSTNTRTIITTTTTLQEKPMTLDDYFGEAFAPAYSPNHLLFFEKDMDEN